MFSMYLVILNRLLCHKFVLSFGMCNFFCIQATWWQGGPQLNSVPRGPPPPFLYSTSALTRFAATCLPALEESWSSQTPLPLMPVQTPLTSPLALLFQTEEFKATLSSFHNLEKLCRPYFQMTQRGQMTCGVRKPLITCIWTFLYQ